MTLSEVPLGHGFTAAGFLHPNEVGHNSMQIPENLGFGATPCAFRSSECFCLTLFQVPKWGVYDGCGLPCQDDDERWCGCSNEALSTVYAADYVLLCIMSLKKYII